MRLLSQTSRIYKGKKYAKFWVVVPNWIIEQLGLKRGQELKPEIKGDKLVIQKA